ncbi:ESX secretion-associated protein EspG [Amycolatopsis cihanbeyliensis]|uniref:ESAT-6 protein secretion system EspG family protein n=1 Tax=Amycolatopsis cihanbeyliensis TaxID=1128664 RepID=A0A542DD43_AMYCI|nr:ESX secretion-associated protein EspG [Amycolatopsis cihanbeyliensis]TQJ00991.1 ESAT-6 protein secretion system EspG family protein [Amycolatopsis cihanbeyliensis]
MTVTTEPPVEHGVPFSLPELDLLATFAGERFPFPLRVPSFGRIEGERKALLGGAAQALSERGLATARGPVGAAADLVTALREHRSTVDLVVVDRGKATGVLAMVHGRRAVVCRQSIGGTPGPVAVTRVTATALTDEFTNRIPRVEAAPAAPITLPPGVVGDATRLLENTAGIAAPRKRVRTLIRERGGDEAAVDALVELVPPVTGRGQLGTVVRRAGGAERPLELSWLDSPQGRIRVDNDARGWVSINPLRRGELVRVLREAATLARR